MKTKKEILSDVKLNFYKEIKKYTKSFKPTKEIDGVGSAAIVGEKNYPNLQVHNVSNHDKESSFFNTNKLVRTNYADILKVKAKNILCSTDSVYAKKVGSRTLKDVQDIYKSRKITEFTSHFENEIKLAKPVFSNLQGVLGTRNRLSRIDINENVSTSKIIEKWTEEDVKSKEAIIALYERGVCEQQIINLLSLGQFGMSLNKKIVPSRWAITAYDRAIEKHLYSQIIKYKIIEGFEVFSYFDKGNYFVVILFPEPFSFENYEKSNDWQESDFVQFNNKLKYKDPKTAGGFFASKVATFEYLKSKKKQAGVVVLRIIENYEVPLGVVFVRECIRQACSKKALKFKNRFELDEFLKNKYKEHYHLFLNCQTLKNLKTNRKLNDFF